MADGDFLFDDSSRVHEPMRPDLGAILDKRQNRKPLLFDNCRNGYPITEKLDDATTSRLRE